MDTSKALSSSNILQVFDFNLAQFLLQEKHGIILIFKVILYLYHLKLSGNLYLYNNN